MTDMSTVCFTTRWHPIAHACELEAPGSFVRLRWWRDLELVAWRPVDGGEVVVFDNVCPHRGARIFDQHWGIRKFTCPYHGTSYREGQLVVPPALKGVAPMTLRTFPAEWHGKWLFASIAPTRALPDQLGEVGQLLNYAGDAISTRTDFCSRLWRCDWRVGVENALEDVHVPLVHPHTLGRVEMTDEQSHHCGENSWSAYKIGDRRTELGLQDISRRYFDGEQMLVYFTMFLFPFSQLSTTGGMTFSLQNWFPSRTGGGARTVFYHRTYGARQRADVPDADVAPLFASAAQMNRRIFDEDSVL